MNGKVFAVLIAIMALIIVSSVPGMAEAQSVCKGEIFEGVNLFDTDITMNPRIAWTVVGGNDEFFNEGEIRFLSVILRYVKVSEISVTCATISVSVDDPTPPPPPPPPPPDMHFVPADRIDCGENGCNLINRMSEYSQKATAYHLNYIRQVEEGEVWSASYLETGIQAEDLIVVKKWDNSWCLMNKSDGTKTLFGQTENSRTGGSSSSHINKVNYTKNGREVTYNYIKVTNSTGHEYLYVDSIEIRDGGSLASTYSIGMFEIPASWMEPTILGIIRPVDIFLMMPGPTELSFSGSAIKLSASKYAMPALSRLSLPVVERKALGAAHDSELAAAWVKWTDEKTTTAAQNVVRIMSEEFPMENIKSGRIDFDPTFTARGATMIDGTFYGESIDWIKGAESVKIGPAAFESIDSVRATMVHEVNGHVKDLTNGVPMPWSLFEARAYLVTMMSHTKDALANPEEAKFATATYLRSLPFVEIAENGAEGLGYKAILNALFDSISKNK